MALSPCQFSVLGTRDEARLTGPGAVGPLLSVAIDAPWTPTVGRRVLSSAGEDVGQGRLQRDSLGVEFGHFLLLTCLALS